MYSVLKFFHFRRFGVISLTVFCTFLLFVSMGAAQDFSKYHTYDELTRALRLMVNEHRNIAKLESIGKTLEGRDILLVEIANPKGVPVEQRPALFIGANFEGDHLIGSEIALYIVDYLLKNYNSNSEVKEKIDNHVFYIVPRVNPDAAEMFFANVKIGRKTNTKPYDGDNDGRMDEDGPEDLNKDGCVTVMRARDTEGEYMINPGEPRLMKKADPKKGETGIYNLYWEGIDNDKDGFINEDPPGGIDINRNFQHEYPYYSPDAGWHMISELESRAIVDWIIAHRNVAIILTFGESDNLITAPNSRGQLGPAKEIDLFKFADASNDGASEVGIFPTGRRVSGFRGPRSQPTQQQQQPSRGRPSRGPATTVDTTDIEYFSIISKKYVELTGIKNQPVVRKPQGAFFQYGYYQFGVPSFSTPGWGISSLESESPQGRQSQRGAGSPRPSGRGQTADIDSLLLKWMDSDGIDGFANWTKYNHPELGEVEIGGFKPYAVTNPPAEKIASLGVSHAEFVVYLGTLFPQVKIAKTEVTNHGGGIFRIKAEVENAGFLPTSLAHGVRSRSVKPTMVQLGIEPEAVISGNNKTSFFQSLAGSGKRQKYEWLIKGKSGVRIELKVVSQKGGSDKTTITLK